MGKTKVFLRNKAFETLERIRIRKHVVAATTINSVMRMFLARKAYLVIRNAHRAEMRAESERRTQLRSGFETHHEVTDRRGGEPIRHSERNGSVNQLAVKYNDHRIKRFEQTATSFQWILVDKRWVKSNSHM
jgi:myosin heavy subunit